MNIKEIKINLANLQAIKNNLQSSGADQSQIDCLDLMINNLQNDFEKSLKVRSNNGGIEFKGVKCKALHLRIIDTLRPAMIKLLDYGIITDSYTVMFNKDLATITKQKIIDKGVYKLDQIENADCSQIIRGVEAISNNNPDYKLKIDSELDLHVKLSNGSYLQKQYLKTFYKYFNNIEYFTGFKEENDKPIHLFSNGKYIGIVIPDLQFNK